MSNTTYVSLTRQSGLREELQVLANNLANSSTAGFQREGVVFAEYVSDTGDPDTSLSMAMAGAHLIDRSQGQLSQTGGTFDFAIEGEGYFLIETPLGDELTRLGNFTPGPAGELVTFDGYRVLDSGGSAIFIPPDAENVVVAADGTLSADGRILAQLGLFRPEDPIDMQRSGSARFAVEGRIDAVEDFTILQGFQESSNVDPVLEVARLIEVQRAYEQSAKLLSEEHDRIKSVIDTIG